MRGYRSASMVRRITACYRGEFVVGEANSPHGPGIVIRPIFCASKKFCVPRDILAPSPSAAPFLSRGSGCGN